MILIHLIIQVPFRPPLLQNLGSAKLIQEGSSRIIIVSGSDMDEFAEMLIHSEATTTASSE